MLRLATFAGTHRVHRSEQHLLAKVIGRLAAPAARNSREEGLYAGGGPEDQQDCRTQLVWRRLSNGETRATLDLQESLTINHQTPAGNVFSVHRASQENFRQPSVHSPFGER